MAATCARGAAATSGCAQEAEDDTCDASLVAGGPRRIAEPCATPTSPGSTPSSGAAAAASAGTGARRRLPCATVLFSVTARMNRSGSEPAATLVRRVGASELFARRGYQAFFTNSTLDTVAAGQTHRDHAIVEQVIAEQSAGPPAHLLGAGVQPRLRRLCRRPDGHRAGPPCSDAPSMSLCARPPRLGRPTDGEGAAPTGHPLAPHREPPAKGPSPAGRTATGGSGQKSGGAQADDRALAARIAAMYATDRACGHCRSWGCHHTAALPLVA